MSNQSSERLAWLEAILDPEGHCCICKDPSPSRIFYARFRDRQQRLRGVCYWCAKNYDGDWDIGSSLRSIKAAILAGQYDE